MPKNNNIKKLEHHKSKFVTLTDKIYENQLEMMNKINEIIDFLNDDSGFNQEIDELQPNGTTVNSN